MFSLNKQLVESKTVSRYKKKRIVYSSSDFGVKIGKHFSGACPPEIFVGRFNYPQVNAGILSPNSFEDSQDMSMPEAWYAKKFGIGEILTRRNQLVYGRFSAKVQDARKTTGGENVKLLNLVKEISMAYKPVNTELFLKKIPKKHTEVNKISPIITNVSPLENARLQENVPVLKKVDYIVGDDQSRAVDSLQELYQSNVPISNLSKILSAGLLGLKTQRKLVPTRWSITAVDDTLSKQLLKKIVYYPEISDITLYHSEYNGNHYEILLLPGNFSFEVIEGEMKLQETLFWHDYERFSGKKQYASSVVGAYYACRLAVCEYLERIKRQAVCLFFREVRPEYYAPLGVGILRECTRGAFNEKPERFGSVAGAFEQMQERMELPVDRFREKSVLLKEYGKQKKLWDFK